jgi:hypothetical protein
MEPRPISKRIVVLGFFLYIFVWPRNLLPQKPASAGEQEGGVFNAGKLEINAGTGLGCGSPYYKEARPARRLPASPTFEWG